MMMINHCHVLNLESPVRNYKSIERILTAVPIAGSHIVLYVLRSQLPPKEYYPENRAPRLEASFVALKPKLGLQKHCLFL